MKSNLKQIVLIIDFILSSYLINAQSNTWVQKSDLGFSTKNNPNTRYNAVTFSIGNKGYYGTGTGNNGLEKDFWEYDPLLDIWTQKADFAGSARSGAVGFSIGNKGYLGTGSSLNDFWEYDPTSNSWLRKADFVGVQRRNAVGFSIQSKGYIGTGVSGSNYLNDFWEYDPSTDTWTARANFGGAGREYAVGFEVNGKGYIGTGNANGSTNNDFWEYNPSSNSWTKKANFANEGPSTFGIYAASGFGIGSFGYITLGQGRYYTDVPTKELWQYNPSTNTWLKRANFTGDGRLYSKSFVINGEAYVGGGFYSKYFTDFYKYNPSTNSWSSIKRFGSPSRASAVAFSIGNKGYLGTGSDGERKKDFWEYDPTTDVWTQKADFGGTARGDACGFSIGNKGYLGLGNDGVYKRDFWEYDPTSNQWTQKSNFLGSARHMGISFSVVSKGYIGLGEDNNERPVDFYEYDPAFDQWTPKADFPGTIRISAATFSIGNMGIVCTGYQSFQATSELWLYNTTSNSWSQRASFPGGVRSGATGFSIGNRGFVGGGFSSSVPDANDFYEYNPTNNSWAAIDKVGNSAVYLGNGFSIGNKGYVFSGSNNQFWEYGLNASTTLTWIGNINSNWNTANNWSPAIIPTRNDNVIILPSSFPPTVQSNVILNGLTVVSGAFIKVNPSITLSVSGSIFNQGNICRNGGTILGIVTGSPILNAVPPSVSILVSPSTTISALSNAVFTATVVNLNGGSPSYTFFVNSLARQTSSVSSFSISSLTNLSTVTSSVTINGNTCLTQNTANSNGIVMQVNKLPQSINFLSFSNTTFGSPNVTLPGFSSAGLPIAYNSSNTSLASVVNNNEVRILGAGTLTVTAFQNGNDFYLSAPQVQQILVVQKADQTIDFGPISPKNPQSPSFKLVSTASSGLIVSYISSNLSVATISGNTVIIKGTGTTTITGSQAGNANYNQATTISQILVVSPILGIEEDLEFDIKIFPNPANSRIFVEGIPSNTKIKLFNLLGKEMRSKEASRNTSFDLAGLEPGEYLIRITSESKTTIRKFIIE